MDHKKVAADVVKAVGEDNIVAAAHCATRLRLVLKDESKLIKQLWIITMGSRERSVRTGSSRLLLALVTLITFTTKWLSRRGFSRLRPMI